MVGNPQNKAPARMPANISPPVRKKFPEELAVTFVENKGGGDGLIPAQRKRHRTQGDGGADVDVRNPESQYPEQDGENNGRGYFSRLL